MERNGNFRRRYRSARNRLGEIVEMLRLVAEREDDRRRQDVMLRELEEGDGRLPSTRLVLRSTLVSFVCAYFPVPAFKVYTQVHVGQHVTYMYMYSFHDVKLDVNCTFEPSIVSGVMRVRGARDRVSLLDVRLWTFRVH